MTTQTSGKVLTRDFIWCCLGQATFGLAYYSLIPTLPLYLVRLGSTEAKIGVLIGTLSFASMVLKPFIGGALLRIPEKTFMIIGGLFTAFTYAAYLVALPFWPFLIVRVVQGVGMACFHTAAYSCVARVGSEDSRGQRLSYFLLAWNLAGALGPAIGMFLIDQFNFSILFLASLALSCGTLLAAGAQTSHPSAHRAASPEIGSLLSVKAVPPSIICLFSFFILGSVTAFFPIYAINQGIGNPGLFFTTVAVMLIAGRALGGRIMDYFGSEKVIPPCIIAYILSMGILAFAKTLPLFLLAAGIMGLGHAFLIPILMVYALERGGEPGPVMGTFHGFLDLGHGLGPMTMGVILHAAGYRTMFLSLALIGFANLAYFFFFAKKKS